MSQIIYDVAIVGAGLSGLTVASTLLRTLEGQIKVIVLEARERVGGRTHTVQVDGDGNLIHDGCEELPGFATAESKLSVDVGGQWVGLQHSRILQLVDQFKLLLEPQIYPMIQEEEGSDVKAEPSSAHKTLTLVEAVNYPPIKLTAEDFDQVEEFLSYVDDLAHQLDLNQPWNHPLSTELDAVSLQDMISRRIPSPQVQHHISLFAQTVLSCDPADVSFFFFLVYLISGGGFEALGDGEQGAQKWKIIGGVQQLSRCMHQQVVDAGGHCLFKAAVKKVYHSDKMHQLILADSSPVPFVTAKKVVFALSPLLISRMEFQPPLPLGRQKLCEGFIRPSCIKVFVIYDRQFWLNPLPSLELPHFSDLGPVHNVFHATLGADLFGLVGLITGAEAKKISERDFTHDELKQVVLEQYRAMYGPSALNAKFFLFHDWSKEEYSGGCFASLLPPNILSRYGAFLRQPINNMHWCATETAEEYCGYFEGAIRSGDRVAQEILSAFSPSSKL